MSGCFMKRRSFFKVLSGGIAAAVGIKAIQAKPTEIKIDGDICGMDEFAESVRDAEIKTPVTDRHNLNSHVTISGFSLPICPTRRYARYTHNVNKNGPNTIELEHSDDKIHFEKCNCINDDGVWI